MQKPFLVIAKFPDYIYDKPRQNVDYVLGQEHVTFLLDTVEIEVEHEGKMVKKLKPKIDYVKDVGVLNYFKGVSFPAKGCQMPQAMLALNHVKKILLTQSRLALNPSVFLSLLLNKEQAMNEFNVVFDQIYGYHSITSEYMCRGAFAVEDFLTAVLGNRQFAHNIAQIPEQDDAYRYRPQDWFTELDVALFRKNPHKELNRLKAIWESREKQWSKGVFKKFEHAFLLLHLLLLIPSFRRKVKDNIHRLKVGALDRADLYWVSIQDYGYNFGGLSSEERFETYCGEERPYMRTVTL